MTAAVAHGPSWLNPAGGLRYHLRGFRHARRLWWPFRFGLAEWLYTFEPPERRLVLVGPSAGYCIEPLVFERYDQLICLEPDPVARFLFKRRLSRAPLEHRPKLEFVSEDLLLGDPSRFGRFLHSQGEAAVLFSNVLGQLRVLLGTVRPDERFERTQQAIVGALEGRSWASFHDRVSGSLMPGRTEPLTSPRRLSDAELVAAFYDHHLLDMPRRGLIGIDGELPLLDHLTGTLFAHEREHRYFVWELMPGHYHLIEATHSLAPRHC